MQTEEAIRIIRANWPPSNYTMLREALEHIIIENAQLQASLDKAMILVRAHPPRVKSQADILAELEAYQGGLRCWPQIFGDVLGLIETCREGETVSEEWLVGLRSRLLEIKAVDENAI